MMDILAFGYTLLSIRQIRDFHPLEACTARYTSKAPAHRFSPAEQELIYDYARFRCFAALTALPLSGFSSFMHIH